MTDLLPNEALTELHPLARTIAEVLRTTPANIGDPASVGDLAATITLKVSAYMGPIVGGEADQIQRLRAERDALAATLARVRDTCTTVTADRAEHWDPYLNGQRAVADAVLALLDTNQPTT